MKTRWRREPQDAAMGILVVLGFAAAAALVGIQIEAWFR